MANAAKAQDKEAGTAADKAAKDQAAADKAAKDQVPNGPAGRPAATEKDYDAQQKEVDAAKTKAPTFKPLKAEDDKENPVFVEVPKNPEDVAKEGTALGNAGAAATGGLPPDVDADDAHANKRIWALDADHNTNLRNDEDAPGATKPDYVEIG